MSLSLRAMLNTGGDGGLLRRVRLPGALITLLLLVVAFLVLYPLAMIVFASLRDAPPGQASNYTLDGYVQTYTSWSTYQLLWQTIWLSAVRTVLAVGSAVFLAWVVYRTDTPCRRLIDRLMIFRFFLPPLPMILAWALIFSKKSGLMNRLVFWATGSQTDWFDVYSYWGLIWVSIMVWTAFLYIFIAPAFKAMDASLEESSRMSGASWRTTLMRVTLPLMAPALLATIILAFVRMMESFDVELFLGNPAGIYVYTTRIFQIISFQPPEYPRAMALGVMLLVVVFILVVVQWRLLGARQFTTVTGRGYQSRPMSLGRWRWVTFAAAMSFVVITTFLPLGVLILTTFMKFAGIYSAQLLTLQNYATAFSKPQLMRSIINTLIVGFLSATAGMMLCALIAYIIVRTKFVGRKILDLLAWIPWTVPAIVMSLGFFWAFVFLPLPFTFYGTVWLLSLAFVVRGIPLGTSSMRSVIMQIGSELEEASRVHGASWTLTFMRVWMPLLRAGFLSGWLILFAISIRDLTTVILLYTPDSVVLSTVFFNYWAGGFPEAASVVGLIQTVIVFIGFGVMTLFGRERTTSVV